MSEIQRENKKETNLFRYLNNNEPAPTGHELTTFHIKQKYIYVITLAYKITNKAINQE